MATKVEFEVEGSTVEDLGNNAVATAEQVSGPHKYEFTQMGRVREDASYAEGGLNEIPKRVITRWRQEFIIKVDF